MAAQAIIEEIWHFAGYWHLFDDVATTRILYKGGASFRFSEADSFHLGSTPARPAMIDTLGALRLKAPQIQNTPDPSAEGMIKAHLPASYAIPLSLPVSFAGHKAVPLSSPSPSGSVSGPNASTSYDLTYILGGHDKIAALTQINSLNDSDLFNARNQDVSSPFDSTELTLALDQMIQQASAHQPVQMQLLAQAPAGQLASLLARHDESGSHVSADDAVSGHYVNGEKHDAPAPATPDDVLHLPEYHGKIGQMTQMGDNTATNAAVILDTSNFASTLVVGHNHYATDAIIQINVLHDHDRIDTSGGLPSALKLQTSVNQTDNIADIVTHDLDVRAAHGPARNFHVNVDLVKGDLIDVRAIYQTNRITDTDVVIETTSSNFASVRTGSNEDVNLARFQNWGKHYDVVMVNGSYHSANLIYQTNILLDDDVLKLTTPDHGDDLAVSLDTGSNTLSNQAGIIHYGQSDALGMSDDLSSLMQHLVAQDSIEASAWWPFGGSAFSQFNVLVVTGDYYDISLISQTNILSDADFAHQTLDTSGHAVLDIRTGGNELHNVARIIDTGPALAHHVGGDYYSDSLLIQANIVSDSDQIRLHPTQALVPEVAAFITMADTADETHDILPALVTSATPHHDVMGQMLA